MVEPAWVGQGGELCPIFSLLKMIFFVGRPAVRPSTFFGPGHISETVFHIAHTTPLGGVDVPFGGRDL